MYVAEIPELPGVNAFAETPWEAVERAYAAAVLADEEGGEIEAPVEIAPTRGRSVRTMRSVASRPIVIDEDP